MKNAIILFCLFPFYFFGQEALVSRADALISEKKYVQAEAVLKKAFQDGNDSSALLEKLGDVYGHQKNWGKAAVYYKKLRDRHPDVANYHYKYGGVIGMKALENKLKAIGLIGDIKSSFIKAAELDPTHIEARWALVELYMQLPGVLGGSKKKSLKYAEELEALSKVDGFLAKGYIYEYDNEPVKAEEYYRNAVRVGGSVTCYEKLATLYEKKTGEPDKAIQTMEEAQKKHNRNALHYQIGKVCADYNIQLDKGIQCLNTYIENYSVKDGVPVEWAYYRIAQIYRHKGDKANALKWVDKALDKHPGFEEAAKEKKRISTI